MHAAIKKEEKTGCVFDLHAANVYKFYQTSRVYRNIFFTGESSLGTDYPEGTPSEQIYTNSYGLRKRTDEAVLPDSHFRLIIYDSFSA